MENHRHFKMSPEVRDMVIHMIQVEKIKTSKELVERVTAAGHLSPITGKPYNNGSGQNWLRRFDPDFKLKLKPKRRVVRMLDLESPTPTVVPTSPPPQVVSPPEPLPTQQQRVAIIVCPLSEIQNVVSEVCKKT